MPKAFIENAKEGIIGITCAKNVPLGKYELVLQKPGMADIVISVMVVPEKLDVVRKPTDCGYYPPARERYGLTQEQKDRLIKK